MFFLSACFGCFFYSPSWNCPALLLEFLFITLSPVCIVHRAESPIFTKFPWDRNEMIYFEVVTFPQLVLCIVRKTLFLPQTVSSNCWLFSTVSLLPCDRIKSNLQISPNQAVLYSVYGQSAAPHKNKVKRRPRNLEVGLHNRPKSKTVYYKQYDCKVK